MKKITLFILSIWCILAVHGQIVPYLQNSTSESMIVNWRTKTGTESKIYYGKVKTNLDKTVNGVAELFTGAVDNNYSYTYHTVRLTDLEPNTVYYYKAESNGVMSDIYSFKTQPQIGEGGTYRFLIMGDHQAIGKDYYVRLMQAAKEIAEEKYGTPIEQYINLITNVGDQVDNGSLKQYDQVHFKQSETLSPYLPIAPIVGNHELRKGDENPLNWYKKHFFADEYEYKGIKSNSPYYYAMQQGRALFLMLSSEHVGSTQRMWAEKVIEAAKTDANVDWIFSYNHRPLQAEQYVGDISVWVRDEIMPLLNETEKSVMNVAGHHHLYHRGQLRDYPAYHIISGGAGWVQRWGDSNDEQDFDDVQKTIDYWNFQIVELNSAEKSMKVESYAIGNDDVTFSEPLLIDYFSRTLGKAAPNKPSIAALTESQIELPYTFESSAYSTSSDEDYNSVQFQIASDENFTKLQFDLIRDYENIYGLYSGEDKYTDLNKDVDIFKQTITKDDIINGEHYIRVRHRDRNLEWSDWSDALTFTTVGGKDGDPVLSFTKDKFAVGEEIELSYNFMPNEAGQWIGIYAQGLVPGTGGAKSEKWSDAVGVSGSQKYTITKPGVYFGMIFRNQGSGTSFDTQARTGLFYVGSIPAMSTEKEEFTPDERIEFSYSNAPNLSKDWVCLYREGDIPGAPGITSIQWKYVTGASGNISFDPMPEGDYYITYCMQDKYFEPGERVYIRVKEKPGGTTGIQDTDKIDLNVLTDIRSNTIRIDYPTNKSEQANLYSVAGIQVKSFNFVNNTFIDTNSLRPGLYILSVGEKTVKVLVR